jgi:hypothetical protein
MLAHPFPPPALRLPIDRQPTLRRVGGGDGGGGGGGGRELEDEEARSGLKEGDLGWREIDAGDACGRVVRGVLLYSDGWC